MTTVQPFATLGIEPAYDLDLVALERTYRELARALHPDRYVSAPPSERRAALSEAVLVNEAWRTLKDPVRRAEALLETRGVHVGDGHEPKASPTFLMEMMEQREALSFAKESSNTEEIRSLAAHAEQALKRCEQALSRGFREARTPGDLEAVAKLLGEVRFHKRFLEETAALLFDATDTPHDAL